MDIKSIMIILVIFEILGPLICYLGGKGLKKQEKRIDYITPEDLGIIKQAALIDRKKVRKILHLNKTWPLITITIIGFCLLFFSLLIMAVIILYILTVQFALAPLLFLTFIISNLIFLSVKVMPLIFKEENNALEKKIIQGTPIIFDGKEY